MPNWDIYKRVIGPGGAGLWVNQYSLLLDGVDEYVNIDNVRTALASTTVGTWSCWVKPVDATPAAVEMFITFGDTSALAFLNFWILSTGVLRAQAYTGGATQWNTVTDAAAFTSGVWTHIAIVQNGTAPVLYVNGVAVAQTLTSGADDGAWLNAIAGLDNGRIGCRNNNGGGNTVFFNGNIDEVIFINRALTQPEISNIYNSGSPKDESGIANGVSYFRMGDKGTYAGGVWTFPDQIGSNDAVSVNCEFADRELDVP